MRGRVAEVAAVLVLAAIVTVVIALPVLRAPSERVFGMEIVGRHYDPFTVMAQLERPIAIGVYLQPVTDVTGALIARLWGGVAAYNWLVLLSFPLSAVAAYLLARHLALSPSGATLAAMAYAFSPFHLAHAAYHAHIAQTQWVPLYLLALWRCLDDASPKAVAFLGAATMAVTLSNFYGGLIAAVLTPVAVAAYWLALYRGRVSRADPSPVRSVRRRRSIHALVVTVGTLMLVAVCGIGYISYAAPAVLVNGAAFAYSRADLFRYSAKWWSYLLPPVEHPLLGAAAHGVWNAMGVREGLLEQQVSLGWGIIALGLIAVWRWLVRTSPEKDGVREPSPVARVPVLIVVAVAALVCSLSPERTIGAFTFVRPSALLYHVVPMFRSYARFGVVVQLMAALLAGGGVDHLLSAGTRRAKILCLALVALAAGDYAVFPPALWRDVLPTTAHRWIMRQPGNVRALDCTPFNQESQSVPWLTGNRVALLGGAITDCKEPNLPQKLAAIGYTHLLLRRRTGAGQWLEDHRGLEGLLVAGNFDDGQVFVVTASAPAIYTATMTGFFPREDSVEGTWRWMGKDAVWTIVNTRTQPIVTTLGIELSAFHVARRMELRLDEHEVQTFVVEPSRRMYQIGPLTLKPGGHELVFHPVEAPTVADEVVKNRDRRPLSFAVGTWSWSVRGGEP